jgi:hypothetical protein
MVAKLKVTAAGVISVTSTLDYSTSYLDLSAISYGLG